MQNGVRALMLNVFDKTEDVWLCQKCDKHDKNPNDKVPFLLVWPTRLPGLQSSIDCTVLIKWSQDGAIN